MREIKNKRLRIALAERGMTQRDLAQAIGEHDSGTSVLMRYELSEAEQDEMIKKLDVLAKHRG